MQRLSRGKLKGTHPWHTRKSIRFRGQNRERNAQSCQAFERLDTQPALDGIIEVLDDLIKRLTLGQAAGQGGDFRPVAAFFGGMDEGRQVFDANVRPGTRKDQRAGEVT